jgi:hypothetical protein
MTQYTAEAPCGKKKTQRWNCSYRSAYTAAKLIRSGIVVIIITSDDTVVVDDRHATAADAISASILRLLIPDPGVVGNRDTFLDDAPMSPDISPYFSSR